MLSVCTREACFCFCFLVIDSNQNPGHHQGTSSSNLSGAASLTLLTEAEGGDPAATVRVGVAEKSKRSSCLGV